MARATQPQTTAPHASCEVATPIVQQTSREISDLIPFSLFPLVPAILLDSMKISSKGSSDVFIISRRRTVTMLLVSSSCSSLTHQARLPTAASSSAKTLAVSMSPVCHRPALLCPTSLMFVEE